MTARGASGPLSKPYPAINSSSSFSNRRSIAAGVLLLAGGLIVGYLQARSVYGIEKWWCNDPKIYLTTITLASYVAILALSGRPTFKGRHTAVASVLGFFLVMATLWASVFWSDFHRFH